MVTRASARKKLRVKGPLTAFDEFIMGKDNGLRPRTFSPHSCWVEQQVIQIEKTSENFRKRNDAVADIDESKSTLKESAAKLAGAEM